MRTQTKKRSTDAIADFFEKSQPAKHRNEPRHFIGSLFEGIYEDKITKYMIVFISVSGILFQLVLLSLVVFH